MSEQQNKRQVPAEAQGMLSSSPLLFVDGAQGANQ